MPKRFSIDKIVELLRIFAAEPSNIYRVAQLPGWNNPSAHRYVHYAFQQHYLELDREENDKGLPAKFYRITEKGRRLLAAAPEPAEAMEVAERDLPEIPEKKPRKKEKNSTGIYIRTA